ncbi:MAG: tetratricopeptide repeat protein [Paracoccaceae bacterium]|nr:tetratricopeptide repeat protein [Paracoccaceae bacterium]
MTRQTTRRNPAVVTLLQPVLALLLCLGLTAAPGQTSAQALETLNLEALTARAEAGEVAAQRILGVRYQDGTGVIRNFATAAGWFTRAADAGDAEAQNRLGQFYATGLGVAADRALALRWLEAAAQQGDPQHLFDLAATLEKAPETPEVMARVAALYQQAADAGHLEATVSLGLLYQNGTGVAQDYTRARRLYEAAADQGHARAQNNLGLLYVRGHGVPQDYDRAFALFEAAAAQGLAQALTNLGVMYENGFGVAHDETRAAALYRQGGAGTRGTDGPVFVYDPRIVPPPTDAEGLADLRADAQAGDPVAQFQLAWLLLQAETVPIANWRLAADLFKTMAEAGHAASMANLGLLYEQGRGVPQDFVLGQMWLSLAVTAGLETALPHSTALQARMTPDQMNEAQARAAAHWQAR